MRYLRKQILNRNVVTGQQSLYIDINGEAVIDQPYSLLIPKGPESDRPSSPVTGMLRFNTTTGEFEGYQSGNWRSLRYKEPGGIVVQTLSEVGDGSTVIFGPLTPNPLSTLVAQSGTSWDLTQAAKNIIVLVENVVQIAGVNYQLIQNPAGNYGGNPGVDMPDGVYLQFGSAVPANKPVHILHNFDR
jgi:hypothetical protein